MAGNDEIDDWTLAGRLVGATRRTDTSGVTVWFSYRPIDADPVTIQTVSDLNGEFSFTLPSTAVTQAKIGALIEGATPVDLEPTNSLLEPGEIVLIIDDIVASHQRYS